MNLRVAQLLVTLLAAGFWLRTLPAAGVAPALTNLIPAGTEIRSFAVSDSVVHIDVSAAILDGSGDATAAPSVSLRLADGTQLCGGMFHMLRRGAVHLVDDLCRRGRIGLAGRPGAVPVLRRNRSVALMFFGVILITDNFRIPSDFPYRLFLAV